MQITITTTPDQDADLKAKLDEQYSNLPEGVQKPTLEEFARNLLHGTIQAHVESVRAEKFNQLRNEYLRGDSQKRAQFDALHSKPAKT